MQTICKLMPAPISCKMKKLFSVVVCFVLFMALASAQKYDYQWPMGYEDNFSIGFGISMLDFNMGQVHNYPFMESKLDLSNGGSFICDSTGQLLLVTNNCEIYDRNLQMVVGSDTLTPGPHYNSNCSTIGFYTGVQMSIILPEMGNDSVYYVLNKDSEASNEYQTSIGKNLYLSVVVQKLDGSFYVKERQHLIDTILLNGMLTAGINHDGTKWWTWVHGLNSNTYYKFLIGGEEVVQGPFTQSIGDVLTKDDYGIGQVTFSPDMTKLGIHTRNNNISLYDFDNETGELSNFRKIGYPDDGEYARGLMFSPNSRFVYFSTVHNLYQADLQDSSVVHIAFHESVDEDNWPVGIGRMKLGPDCRLYIDPGSTTYYIHVIHQPNEKGLDCMFQARAIRMPTILSHYIPNSPMYRFNGDCDNNIQFLLSDAEEVHEEMDNFIQVLPNPASDLVKLKAGFSLEDCDIVFYDASGRTMLQKKMLGNDISVDVSKWPNGMYYVQVRRKNGDFLVEKLLVNKY